MSGPALKQEEDIFGLSDEDFLNLNSPADVSAPTGSTDGDDNNQDAAQGDDSAADSDSTDDADVNNGDGDGDASDKDGEDGDEDDDNSSDDGDEADSSDAKSAAGDASASKAADESGGEVAKEQPPKEHSKPKADTAAGYVIPDDVNELRGIAELIMTPFKANGKMITLRDPKEALTLMQMGANYTRKLQDIQPHRKVLMMLENNGLLDEGKLSYLIDLDKKDPAAIQKLIKDSGVDPLDIDTSADPSYTPGNYRVSDNEANLTSAIRDVADQDGGPETLQVIEKSWDETSKQFLWENPDVLATFHEARTSGVYDRIVEEMERQITLGMIPAHTPFVQAYKTAGDALTASGVFKAPATNQDVSSTSRTPVKVAEKAAIPKPKVANGEQASAAAATKAASKPKQQFVNPLSMSDDEFMATFKDRL